MTPEQVMELLEIMRLQREAVASLKDTLQSILKRVEELEKCQEIKVSNSRD